MNLLVQISAGELLDKLTILEIKRENIADDAKTANVAREYAALSEVVEREIGADPEISWLRAELKEINAELWRIEDDIRDRERQASFGAEFIALARAVYRTNDRRAELKRRINLVTRSDLIEEKSYAPY
ncbi:DUF6165 family protein [Rhodoblastus sp.]|uniref:DUF6165 family protein n=1 Tax=Rhodoblastus sp. TaxID=1962975 RepID=UPI00260784AF|nr:DUF6165 family protein [Rhodoblastus sp.]